MFTGIITAVGIIEKTMKINGSRITVRSVGDGRGLKTGESVACNGACLTVVAHGDGWFEAELSPETLSRTVPGQWEQGRKLNLERSLLVGDALDGHMVTGHIDGVANIISIEPSGNSHTICLETTGALSRFIAQKGSVTLDGVSLTVNKAEGARFWVTIIPHTWRHTTLGERKSGDAVNIEIDMIARYLDRLLQGRA